MRFRFPTFGRTGVQARPRLQSRRRGFTLIEAALTTVIVGVGTVGMIELLASGSVANATANDLTLGQTLANNIHEMLQTSPTFNFASPTQPTHWGMENGETVVTADDLDDFDGHTFSPPVDSRRQSLAYLTGWSQTIAVETVDPKDITHVLPHGSMPPDQRPMSRVTVTIGHGNSTICTKSWVVVYAP